MLQFLVVSFWFMVVTAAIGAFILQGARMLPENRDMAAPPVSAGARALIWLSVAWTVAAASWIWVVTVRSAEATKLMDPLPGILASTIPLLIAALPMRQTTAHGFVRNCGRSALAMSAFCIFTVSSIGTFYAPCAVLLMLAGFNAVRASRVPLLATRASSN
jgi:hypothetical protein